MDIKLIEGLIHSFLILYPVRQHHLLLQIIKKMMVAQQMKHLLHLNRLTCMAPHGSADKGPVTTSTADEISASPLIADSSEQAENGSNGGGPGDEALNEAAGAADEADITSALVQTDLYEDGSAEEGPVTTSAADVVSTASQTDDSDATDVADEVTSAANDETYTAPVQTDLYDAVSADEGTVKVSSANVMCVLCH